MSKSPRDIFTRIKWYAIEVASLIMFVVLLYRVVMYELGR